MLSKEEIEEVKKIKGSINKGKLQILLTLFNRETGGNESTCFCSHNVRSRFSNEFNVWFDNNYPNV